MSKSNDGSPPDPVRPVTFVAGSRSDGLNGQFIDNTASRHSQFVDPVNPSGYDAKSYIPGASDERAGTDATTRRAAIVVFAASFVVVNIVLLRNLAASPDTWPPADPLAAAWLYGFSVVTSTLLLGVLGTVLVIACLAALAFVKRRSGRQ
jgi:hypothetical protein